MSEKKRSDTWYVGVMNDCQFIIDEKPCPPTEFVHPGHDPAPNVIAKVIDQADPKETDANAKTIAAAPDMKKALLAWKRYHEDPDAYPTSEKAPWGLMNEALDKAGVRV
jgi:hypothetical protein